MIVCEMIEIGICDNPTCRCVHISLCSGEKKIAISAVHIDDVNTFIDNVRSTAYEVVTLKDNT
jgi:hypothetical protein